MPTEVCIQGANLGRILTRSARYWGRSLAVIDAQGVLTFDELNARVNRLSNALTAAGLRPADRVVAMAWNCHQLLEIECACFKTGIVKVILNARLSRDEIADCIEDADPAWVFVGPDHEDLVRSLARLPAERIVSLAHPYEALLARASDQWSEPELPLQSLAVLHYSSGSTGKLKAAMHTLGNRLASVRKVVMGRLRAQPGDKLLLSGPISHASGMFMQPWLLQGGCLVLLERFEPERVMQALQTQGAVATYMVPTMISSVLAHAHPRRYALPRLRELSYGAAPMAASRITEAWQAFGPVLSQGYGAGETTGGLVLLGIADHARALDGGETRLLSSCGRPFGESQVELLGDDGLAVPTGALGEICVRGPDVFAGYWKSPSLTQEAIHDGWLHTGDLARMDEEGYLYIVDRKKDMIVSGGFNVYPIEVEQVLHRHPAVQDVCVIGMPDAHWGEIVKAVVVLRREAHTSAQDLMGFCHDQLAGYKKPRSVDFVDELPKNASGKVSRKLLKQHYWQGQQRMVN